MAAGSGCSQYWLIPQQLFWEVGHHSVPSFSGAGAPASGCSVSGMPGHHVSCAEYSSSLRLLLPSVQPGSSYCFIIVLRALRFAAGAIGTNQGYCQHCWFYWCTEDIEHFPGKSQPTHYCDLGTSQPYFVKEIILSWSHRKA